MAIDSMKRTLLRIARGLKRRIGHAKPMQSILFRNSADYWETNYASGRGSGAGSYGTLAEFKAEVVNSFVRDREIESVIEFGCGDGNQLKLALYPHYLGFDVSPTAVSRCRSLFAGDRTKEFRLLGQYHGERAVLALSLDVIYHLIEDDVYFAHLDALFGAAQRYVIIYSTDFDLKYEGSSHVRHRAFTEDISNHHAGWALLKRVAQRHPYDADTNMGSSADFFIYERVPAI